MSHLDPAPVDVRTRADHPLVSNGGTSTLRVVAPGAVTAGRYGLVEHHVAPHSPGAPPHVHRTFSESFYVLSVEAAFLRLFAPGIVRENFSEMAELRRSGRTLTPEEMTAFYACHDQVMVGA